MQTKRLASWLFPTLALGLSAAQAAPLPVRLLSVQLEPISAETAEMTPGSNPVIVTGEADSSTFALDQVVGSYDFAICDAKTKEDLGQSPSGHAYVVNGAISKERPNGHYQFVIRYWLDQDFKHDVYLCMKGKPISNALKINGKYAGGKF